MRWLVLLLCGCGGGGEYVVVSVDGVPEGATKIVARSVLDGKPAQSPEVFEGGIGANTSFALKLADNRRGRLAVGVEAWVGDCLTAWQGGEVMLAARVDLALTLAALPAPDCSGAFTPSPDMVPVPAGSFRMGCNTAIDSDCFFDEEPAGIVNLNGFEIDRTEVTIAAYRGCIREGVCESIAGLSSGEQFPVELDWDHAKAYCEFRGKRLPTEAEWEKAARGVDGRRFPWGNEPADCDRAWYGDCGDGGAVEVARFPSGASPYGALDMAGNLKEWVSDWYADHYPPSPRTNPTGPASGTEKVLRGGGWALGAESIRTSVRYSLEPTDAIISTVRCAR